MAGALLETLQHDTSVSVRLASIDALKRFADDDTVRRRTIDALVGQSSPLVQIALIDFIVDRNDRDATEALRRLTLDQRIEEAVRKRAAQALQQIG